MTITKEIPKRIVVIGGGTGTFVVLRGLKHYPVKLSVIVTMSDSGGSNKRIRDEFGLLPTSDIRQCLVALSHENGGGGVLRKLFMYRFEKGRGISGMTFGNLFMAALADILGSQQEAIRQTGKVLRIRGQVIPVSFTKTDLYAEYEDGRILNEEHLIDEPPHDGRLRIGRVYLKPAAVANPEALKAISEADLVILGPGDLYTSLIPNLLVKGLPETLAKTHAKKVYVLNLMTKFGQTYDFTASDHLGVLEKYLGRCLDAVVINQGRLPAKALEFYFKHHERPVIDNLGNKSKYQLVRGDLIGRQLISKAASDQLVRSLIRHDSKKLAKILIEYLKR